MQAPSDERTLGTATVLTIGAAWLATAGLVGVTLVALLGPLLWVFELFTHFRFQYAWIAGVLLGVFLVLRRRLGVLVAGALFAWHGFAVWAPAPDAGPVVKGDPAPLRVLMLNVLGGVRDHAPTLELIAAEDPDVVLLMEVQQHWMDSLEVLDATHRHQLAVVREDNFGIAAWSRVPWDSARELGFGDLPDGRALPSLELRFGEAGRGLDLVFIHPVPPVGAFASAHRNDTLRHAARHARDLGPRAVLCGDFNVTPWSHVYDEVLDLSGMRDSRAGFGLQPTWISRLPAPFRIPLDHVLVAPGVQVVDRRIGPYTGSDHRPVLVDLR